MASDESKSGPAGVGELAGAIVQDSGRLARLHVDLLRSELRQELREAAGAVATIGAGAGLVAAGGILGTLTLVHALHRSTRLPLWGCYGAVGGLMAAVGAGLLATGSRRAAGVELVPRQTIEALRENLTWIRDQVCPSGG